MALFLHDLGFFSPVVEEGRSTSVLALLNVRSTRRLTIAIAALLIDYFPSVRVQ